MTNHEAVILAIASGSHTPELIRWDSGLTENQTTRALKELMDSGRIQRRTRGFYVLVPAMVEVESKKDKNWWGVFTKWK